MFLAHVPLHHTTHGALNPVVAYALSVLGCLLGLQCAARARAVTGTAAEAAWLAGAAVSIGGTGIWAMHFVAMLGFGVDGSPIAYDVPLTLASAILAIVVVGAGLALVARDRPIVIGGVLTGGGVAAMHYTGMAAMNTGATLAYDPALVAASMAIAIAASTAALWFATRLTRWRASLAASLVMAAAVTSMHYTGMAALSADGPVVPQVEGADPTLLLLPMVIAGCVITAVLLVAVGGSASPRERTAEADFVARLERQMRG
ncbi:MHYT domain-containing protein [Actinocorallia longicatena]|uniref:MHYT domain-containing protein n=1 Tax=Actinocorallia longicatena TaxID=111803 RepID=A0ABP6Q352_9ACTN